MAWTWKIQILLSRFKNPDWRRNLTRPVQAAHLLHPFLPVEANLSKPQNTWKLQILHQWHLLYGIRFVYLFFNIFWVESCLLDEQEELGILLGWLAPKKWHWSWLKTLLSTTSPRIQTENLFGWQPPPCCSFWKIFCLNISLYVIDKPARKYQQFPFLFDNLWNQSFAKSSFIFSFWPSKTNALSTEAANA